MIGEDVIGAAQAEVILAGDRGVAAALHLALLAKQEVQDLVEAAEEVQRVRLAQAQGQAAAVTLGAGGQTPRVGEGLAISGDRLGIGVPPRGAVGEACEVLDGLARRGGARVMVGEAIVHVLEPARVQGFERGGHARVQNLAPRGQEAPVGDLLDEGMLEDVDRLAARRLLV